MSIPTNGIARLTALCRAAPEGARVYLPAAAGEATVLAGALAPALGALRRPVFFASLVPGVNRTDYAALAEGAVLETLLLPPELRGGFAAGRVRPLPLSYYGAARAITDGPPFDIAFAHVAPPGADGACSLSLTADFAPLAWARAHQRVLIVNPALPMVAGAPTIAHSRADVVIEAATPPIEIAGGERGGAADAIARHVATLVRDGDTLQMGIGTIPDLVAAELSDRRSLRIHSGAVGGGALALATAGALAPGRVHRTGTVLGTGALHAFVAAEDRFDIVSTLDTHAPAVLGRIERLCCINSALEVDLTGQANLEWRDGRLVSGVGGALDFALGARLSPGGRSILAFPATIGRAGRSRVVARLQTPTVSLPRHLADIMVTEHGIADIRLLAADQRAEALIAIADPASRGALRDQWRDQRGAM